MAGGPDDDRELVARCQAGDQRAWRALVERNAPLVHGILRGAFRLQPEDAEDLFQEVFTRVYLHLGSVRDDRAVSGWVAQVTRNAAVDWLRRAAREHPAAESIDRGALDESLQEVEEALLVRAALDRLPGHQREILDRFFLRDQSYRTIAQELGIPPGTIASRISRALSALRAEYEPVEAKPAASRLSR